jgi:5-methylcytosine-specific restriction enzyme subunit McrC
MGEQRTIRFREYQERFFSDASLSAEEIDRIAHLYGRASADEEDGSQGRQFEVEYMPGAAHARWRVQAQGWVGHIPVTPDLTLVVRPKVPVGNLFRMWEHAYDLRGVEFPEGLTHSRRLDELYSQLARNLATRVLGRARQGFYRDYRSEDDNLSVVRGRIDLRRLARAPWTVNFDCHFQEHTGDVEENRLLAWTLYSIGRSGICTEDVAPIVRQAYRAVQSFTTLEHYHSSACKSRRYNRLNGDYEPLHALCWFFLANAGPHYQVGEAAMVPFMFSMPELFELFVARWLGANAAPGWQFVPHWTYPIDRVAGLWFDCDLVLNDPDGEPVCVLDTKYKKPPKPATSDIAQVVAYAEAAGCRDAILLYPSPLDSPLDGSVGSIRVRSLVFDLKQDLNDAGVRLLADLGEALGLNLLAQDEIDMTSHAEVTA